MIKSVNAFKEDGPFRKITLLYDTSVEIALLTEYIDYHRYMNNSLIFPKNRTNVKFGTFSAKNWRLFHCPKSYPKPSLI